MQVIHFSTPYFIISNTNGPLYYIYDSSFLYCQEKNVSCIYLFIFLYTCTVGDFKKFTFGSKRTSVILLVILLVITIGFYDCLSNYNSNSNCLCCVVCSTGIVLLIDCYMTATKLQKFHCPCCYQACCQLVITHLICSCPSVCGCACNWQLDLFCFKHVNMIVITICLVFTITKVIVKLLHYNGLYKTKCKLFKVTH